MNQRRLYQTNPKRRVSPKLMAQKQQARNTVEPPRPHEREPHRAPPHIPRENGGQDHHREEDEADGEEGVEHVQLSAGQLHVEF